MPHQDAKSRPLGGQTHPIVQGVDYYIENGRWVFTATYHLKRGYCCQNICRHCPYGNGRSQPLRQSEPR